MAPAGLDASTYISKLSPQLQWQNQRRRSTSLTQPIQTVFIFIFLYESKTTHMTNKNDLTRQF